jgi:hypothetical protein
MNKLIEKFRADVRRFWLLVLQSMNGIAVTLGGMIVAVQVAYPDVAKQLLVALPPKYQAIALFAFGAVVHFATRQAKKAAADPKAPGQ